MVASAELWKRESSQSTATFNSLRSSWRSSTNRHAYDESQPVQAQCSQGAMAAAADAALSRRQVKHQLSQGSMRSLQSSSTAASISTSRNQAHDRQHRFGAASPQPRNSFGTVVDRARDFTKSSRVDSNTSKRSTVKAPVRRCETAMQSGRHSNEWLFGGRSLRETVKSFLK